MTTAVLLYWVLVLVLDLYCWIMNDVMKHRTAHGRSASRRAWRVTVRFAPLSVLPLHLFNISS